MKQNFSSAEKIRIVAVIVAIGILLFVLGLLIGQLLRQNGIRLSMLVPQAQEPRDPLPNSAAPTIVVPTADCSPPALSLGSEAFQIQTLTPAADGSLSLPTGSSGVAYWVDGTSTNYAFVLSPAPGNLAVMATITVGSPATVTWSSCDSTTYRLAAPQPGSLSAAAKPDQSVEGITIFFETEPTGAGFVFTGELTGQQITTLNTPSAREVQAEIGLLETRASPDGRTVTLVVSIQNYGADALTVTANDVALVQPEGTLLSPESSKPRLPEKIQVGDVRTFELTFPRPAAPMATLRVFTVEYDVEGY